MKGYIYEDPAISFDDNKIVFDALLKFRNQNETICLNIGFNSTVILALPIFPLHLLF